MLVKIGDGWYDPEKVVGIYPETYGEAAVLLRGVAARILLGCSIEDAQEDLAHDLRRRAPVRPLAGKRERPRRAGEEDEQRENRVVVPQTVPDDMRHLRGEPAVLAEAQQLA